VGHRRQQPLAVLPEPEGLPDPRPKLQLRDAIDYYEITDPGVVGAAAVAEAACFVGAIITASEYMVKDDLAVPVPSHFERVVCEAQKTFLFALAGIPFRKLPRGNFAFKAAVEEE